MKRIRLPRESYESGSPFSVTIVTVDRLPCFDDGRLVAMCVRHLRTAAERYDATVYAYCFMPDHAHLLVELSPGHSLIQFVRLFKQLTSHEVRHGHGGEPLWQRRFYDHALRATEAVATVADYIWDNPVRTGLVDNRYEYPHWGSFVWDVNATSGSEDPDLRGRGPPASLTVGAGLQTRAQASASIAHQQMKGV